MKTGASKRAMARQVAELLLMRSEEAHETVIYQILRYLEARKWDYLDPYLSDLIDSVKRLKKSGPH